MREGEPSFIGRRNTSIPGRDMAENFLSPVGKKLADYALEQFGSMRSIDERRAKVKRALEAIKSVLWGAEEGQFTDDWLTVLKNIAYDADDILDEFNYEDLRCEADNMVNKVLDFFSLHNPLLFRLIMGNKLKHIIDRIEGIAAERNMLNFTFTTQSQAPDGPREKKAHDRQTHSYVDKEIVIGREEEQKKIVDWLLDQRANKKVTVLAIVGMGGLGKTTLAKLVYGDDRVKDHFQKLIWVCVSDQEFNVGKLVKSIIESATEKEHNLSNIDLLQRRLREELSGKRYLLVMDDVWNEDPVRWAEFKDLLGSSREGSTILVTTRSGQVSRIMGASTSYDLPLLSDDDSWTLFRQRAFSPGAGERSELIKIGKAIVKKCGGLPLAIMTLGTVMGTKKEVKEWLAVSGNEIWDIQFGDKRTLAILRLSYNHLPPHLKQCFAFCSIFPKDYEMEKDMLIQLWIANGFIPSGGRKELEVLGEEIFDELVWRSFFQDLRQRANYFKDGNQSRVACKMHDLMHDLAQYIMESECAQLLESGHLEKLPGNVRHLFVSGPCQLDIGKTLNKFQTIFTLLLPETYLDMWTADLSKARSLKVLSLESTNSIELPVKISYLKHLRYLDLSETAIAELPEAISDLFNLQVLKLDYCMKLCKLPEAMRNMRSLRHLYMNYCYSLKHMPAGMGQLSSLKTLTKYIVGDDDAERGIRELKGLNLGGHLELYNLEKVRGMEDASEANLGSKQNLQSLALCWGVSQWHPAHFYLTEAEDHSFDEEAENAEKVLAALEPHRGLKMLAVWRYAGLRFPMWMMDPLVPLYNVVDIHLGYCRRCEHLPPLWQLPDLQFLSLTEMDSIKHLQSSGNEGTVQPFPSLKHLQLNGMQSLESWCGEEGGDPAPPCFPLLADLQIKNCPNLTSIPVLPALRKLTIEGNNKIPLESVLSHTTLSNLNIETSGANSSSETRSPSFPQASISSLKPMNSLERLSITGGEELRPLLEREDETRGFSSTLQFLSLNKCNWLFSRQLSSSPMEIWANLTSLRHLHIKNCDALEFWPEEELRGLISLKSLSLVKCRNLTGASRIPESPSSTSVEQGLTPHLESIYISDCENLMELPKLPASLKTLDIDNCPNMKALTDQLGHLPALKTLYISKCLGLMSLPQWLGHLTALKNLILIECTSLTSLPEGKQGFTTLRRLEIKDCPQLTTLPRALQQRLPSLHRLIIKGCPDLERRCKRGGEYWDLVSRLPAPEIGEQRREQPPSFCKSSCLDCFSPM